MEDHENSCLACNKWLQHRGLNPCTLSLFNLPETNSLTTGLNSVMCANELYYDEITILDRQPNAYLSTFPSEIVTCRFGDGRELQIFCKYELGNKHYPAYGHRGGVVHESRVYDQILRQVPTFQLNYYGTYTHEQNDEIWLFLEYLDQSHHVDEMSIPNAMSLAAHCIGCFHAATESILSSRLVSFLKSYDETYYCGWALRTLQFSRPFHRRFPWLRTLCDQFVHTVADRLNSTITIIHGECCPKNVLVQGEKIFLIDWESTAIAPGEIDLATLTDGWPAEIAQQCENEYQQARWSNSPPAGFKRRLELARMYVQFRWLGELPERTSQESQMWRFDQLYCAGKRLRLI